jgi:hypothetical protein
MQDIPWWAKVSSAAAPVALIGGWTLAGARQRQPYDPVRDTISALAARGATDRWIMTSALAALGACHVVTAAGLGPARTRGRVVLGSGGVATIAVATFPQQGSGASPAHTAAAGVAFLALGAWPALAARSESRVPSLGRGASAAATLALLSLVGWFAAERDGARRGLAERSAAGAEALWPLVVVLAASTSARPHSGLSARRGRARGR